MSLFKNKKHNIDANNAINSTNTDLNISDTLQDNSVEEHGSYQLTEEDIAINYINNNILSDKNNGVLNVTDIDYIDDYKYQYMDKVEAINLLHFIQKIGKSSFKECSTMTKFTIIPPVNDLIISDSAFEYCSNLQQFNVNGNISMLGENAFAHCSNLESIILNGLKEIAPNAFLFNSKLKTVQMPNVTHIGAGAFQYCSSLNDFGRCVNLREIDSFAFSNSGLSKLIIPSSIMYIGGYAFENNFNLTDVYFETNNTQIDLGDDIFKNNKNIVIHTQNKSIIDYCKKYKYNYVG